MEELVSVIVPIYNVEKYLDRCVESIVSQTYTNLEIILVDDGSKDTCSQKCDTWKERDERIRVVHKSNGGLSDARNAGLKIARGDWIAFVDSDDWIAEKFFEKMICTAKKQHSELVECSVKKIWENNPEECESKDIGETNTYNTEQALKLLIEDTIFHQHVWNKIYQGNLIKGIYFEKGKICEDEFWTYQVFGRARNVTKLNDELYYYFQRSNSIMSTAFSIRRLDALEGKYRRQIYIEQYFPNLTGDAKRNFIKTCVFCCQMSIKYLQDEQKQKAVQECEEYIKKINVDYQMIRSEDIKEVVWSLMAKYNIKLTSRIRNFFNIGF